MMRMSAHAGFVSILGTRAAIFVALAGVSALSTTVEAQPAGGRADVKKLNELARSFDARFRKEHAAALLWAQRQGLASMRIEQPNGRIVQLMILRDGRPIYYATTNVNAADSVSADEIQLGGSSGFDLDGTGVGLHIWDGGAVRTTHQELTGRVTLADLVGQSNHSTHVAGTMIATGVSVSAHGMANGATLTSYDFFNDTAEMAAEGPNAVVSNHSYGPISGWDFGNIFAGWTWLGDVAVSTTEDPNFGRYETSARNWDQIAFNAPRWLIVKSAGNQRTDAGPAAGTLHRHLDNGFFVQDTDSHPADGGATGYDTISREGNAKNILTVGAVNDVIGGYSGPGSVTMSSFSSWGPTDDGRIKPDLVGNGVGLFSSVASNDGAYGTFTGTSMSSPNVAGSLALLIQHYRDTHGGADMRSATLKGLAIHTADETGAAPGPDYSFGWGLLNALTAADRVQVDVTNPDAIQELNLSQGQKISQVHTYSGSGPFKATLCWTDPPGAAQPYVVDSTTRVLVNDLDLRVIGPSGTELPWILDGANPGNAATKGDNIRDNVEVVIINAPMAGNLTVQITHKGTLLGASQDCSLILTGIPTNVPTGACCRQGGLVCTVEADPGCLTLNGNFKGDGTTCADDNSDGIADECEEDQVLEVKFSQPPDEDGEDIASNIDWTDEDPNVVLADDFLSDGRPITTVRWWGSNLDEEAVAGPDGWLISFHKPLVALVSSALTGASSAPPRTRSLREDPGPGAAWVRTCERCSTSSFEAYYRVGGEPARRNLATATPVVPSLQSATLNPSGIGAAAAVGSADFQWDDGTAETCIGVNDGPNNGQPFGWANQFTNTAGMSLTLTEIEVAFGCGGAGALAVGDAIDAVVWVDAAATGDMVNATKVVQWSLPGGVHDTSAATFATHAIPGSVTIPAGAEFYVGLGDVQSAIDSQVRFPAALDQTTTAGRSWAFFSDLNVFDPDDLASQTIDLIDNFGLPGNWLIRANAAEFPKAPLALYYCNADIVDATPTALGACDAHPVIEYVADLTACCLVHATEDSRTGQTPAQAVAFFEERCLDYAIDIQAVVGHAFVDDGKDGCADVATGLTAVADFWGWHSTGEERGAEFGLQSALQSTVSMSENDWLYGPWSAATPICSQPNMAFELLTSTPSPPGDPDVNGNGIADVCECGDGLIIAGAEECDDGNTTDGDGCSSSCAEESGWICSGEPSVCSEVCGDGLITVTEECDDGNTTDGDGCSSSCAEESGWICTGEPSDCSEVCGDGLITGAEECDDGNTTDGDGCSSSCTEESGWICTGEPSDCSEVCGDGLITGAEECDDGPLNSDTTPDACRTDCTAARCGDAVIDTDEQCDNGPDNSDTQPDACRADCTPARCGDGVIDTGEQCDDGNLDDGDACTSACLIVPSPLEACGDPFDPQSSTGPELNRTGCFEMPASAVAAGEQTAIRVRMVDLYIDSIEDPVNGCPVRTEGNDLSAFENQVRYLGPPSALDDNDVLVTPKFIAAELQCTPLYRDWTPAALAVKFPGADTSRIYYYGKEVFPCSVHEAQHATQACVESASENCFSTSLEIRTALWGDVWPPFGVVSFTDIGKIVDAFKSIAFVEGNPPDGAPRKVRAMLRENIAPLGSSISFTDIGNAVDAFKTVPYVEDGTTACP